jgi:hypothetical protein
LPTSCAFLLLKVQAYLEAFADAHDLLPLMRFNTRLVRAHSTGIDGSDSGGSAGEHQPPCWRLELRDERGGCSDSRRGGQSNGDSAAQVRCAPSSV